MSSKDCSTHESRPKIIAWIVATFVLLLMLYLLSGGPAIFLLRHGWLDYSIVQQIYKPLELLGKNWPPAKAFFEWYLPLWW